jgi:hypothetical protein
MDVATIKQDVILTFDIVREKLKPKTHQELVYSILKIARN